jgi:hypothetical protein
MTLRSSVCAFGANSQATHLTTFQSLNNAPTDSSPDSSSAAWPLLCGVLALWALLLHGLGYALGPNRVDLALFRFHGHELMQAPWTLWTGSVFHLGWKHCAYNALALVLIGIAGWQLRFDRTDAAGILIMWPLSNALILLWSADVWVLGLSGLNHALAQFILLRVMLDAERSMGLRGAAALVQVVLLSKLKWQTDLNADHWGFTVVAYAHYAGVLAGAVVSAFTAFKQRSVSREF